MTNGNIQKSKISFDSGGVQCAAYLYRPEKVEGKIPCVVMAHGFTGTMDQLVPYAERFATYGLAVLTFDYRHFGESGGEPRQIINVKKQLADWRSAIRLARTLKGIDAKRIALWGSSLSGSHVINIAADDPTITAVVAQVPAIDKSTGGMSKEAKAKMEREGISLSQLVAVSLKLVLAGIYDEIRGLLGFSPYYIPVFGKLGEVAGFTEPRSNRDLEFFARGGSTWRNEFAPRFMFGTPRYKQGTAERIKMPLLVCVAEHDTEAHPELAIEVARKAPHGELESYPVGHFDVYSGDVFEQMVKDEADFLCKNLSIS